MSRRKDSSGEEEMKRSTPSLLLHPRPYHRGDVQYDFRVGGKADFNASIHPDSYVMELQYERK